MSNPPKPADTRVSFAAVLFNAITVAREGNRPIVFVAEPGAGATILAQRIGALFRPFRAPHHTVSEWGLAGELSLAAGGVLYLDEAREIKTSALAGVMATWRMMDGNPAQPLVIAAAHDEADLKRLCKAFSNSPIVIRL